MEKKQIRLFYKTEEFEEFVNHETIDVIDIQIKAMENSAMFQESFFAIVFFKESSPPSPSREEKVAEDEISWLARRIRNNAELLNNPHMLERVKANLIEIAMRIEHELKH